MKLAISNIAWPFETEDAVADMLSHYGVRGIEIAPTKIWPSPLEATPSQLSHYRAGWVQRGFEIVAAQALLFGRPDLTIFEDGTRRKETVTYLGRIISLCAELGARALVFGSPKNRRVGNLPPDEVARIAVDFFGELAETAHRLGAVVVLEANPAEYGADFITTAADALALVRNVDHPGLLLHLDTACMTLSADPVERIVAEGRTLLGHFHISEPYLGPIGEGGVAHARFARALDACGYSGWRSIEMKEQASFSLSALEHAVHVAITQYFPSEA